MPNPFMPAVFRFACLALVLPVVLPGQLNVIYTGRTLGYLRYPELQTPLFQACDPKPENMTGAAAEFFKVLKGRREGSVLTVGMGDNFGPQLEARSLDGWPKAVTGQQIPKPGKDLFVWNNLAATPEWVSYKDAGSLGLEVSLRNHQGIVPADNVGCFFRAAGYDAIVPGKHDFETGPERLLMLAKFLMSDHKGMPKTAMLGANLAIATSTPDAKARIPLYEIEHDQKAIEKKRGKQKLRQFSVLFPSQNGVAPPKPTLPDVVFPWTNEIAVTGAYSTVAAGSGGAAAAPATVFASDLQGKWQLSTSSATQARLASVLAAADSASAVFLVPELTGGAAAKPVQLQRNVGDVLLCQNPTREPYGFLTQERPDCTVLHEKAGVDPASHSSGTVTYQLASEALRPDHNYAVCLQLANTANAKFACQPFYVATPFFAWETGRVNSSGDPNADPFILKTVEEKTLAVFGVLDPDLQNKIGRMNYGWRNIDDEYETAIQVADPVASLKQALLRCGEVDACRAATKVLLAQMPEFKAEQMAKNLPAGTFQLVVAETDPAYATGNTSTTRRVAMATAAAPTFVVTPDSLYSASKDSIAKLTNHVQKAQISLADTTWTLNNSVESTTQPLTPPATGEFTLRKAAETALLAMKIDPKPSPAKPPKPPFAQWSNADVLTRLALLVMQRNMHADLSMIQSRDIFEPQTYGPAAVTKNNLQELLDRVFWKNDFAVRTPLKGSTLAGMLSASAVFAAAEANPLNTELEKGRSLITVGVFKESAEKNWTVNGGIVDPAKIYSVTMTDFLALGDTGYSALQTPLVPYAYRPKDFKELRTLSGMVCGVISRSVGPLAGAPCLTEPLDGDTYLDTSIQMPPDTGAGLTAYQQARGYADIPLREDRFARFYDGQNLAEKLSAQKPFWSFSLEKGNFGMNINQHKQFSAAKAIQTGSLANQFAGIQVAAVTAPNSYTFSFDHRSRVKRSSQHTDVYLMDDIAYSYSRTQDASDNNYLHNLSLNSLALESGLLFHVYPSKRQPRQLDLLFALRADSQVLSPREDLQVAAKLCGSVTDCPAQNPCPANVDPSAANPCTKLTSKGVNRGTIRRAADVYLKAGIRWSDTRSWMEVGFSEGESLQVPYALRLLNGQADPFDLIYLTPGSSSNYSCPSTPGACAAPPKPVKTLDQLTYLSYYGYLTNSTKLQGIYQTHPLQGLFLNFSLNFPLPVFNRYADWAGGKGLAFLAENNGRFYLNRHQDLPSQTRYFDRLSLALVIPMVGNFSFKPQVDLIYYRDKVADLPFHSVTYMTTVSYTFDWRQGQPLSRVWRFASPAPTATVPSSGR